MIRAPDLLHCRQIKVLDAQSFLEQCIYHAWGLVFTSCDVAAYTVAVVTTPDANRLSHMGVSNKTEAPFWE